MSLSMAELLDRFACDGRLDWIGTRPARREPIVPAPHGRIGETGLDRDRHPRANARSVTLIQAEHLPVIAALAGHAQVAPETLRRNLVVSGLNLSALRGGTLRIGPDAVLRLTGPCAPCSRMEEALGPGGYTAMRGHGGWCAEVIAPGEIAVGMAVQAGGG